MKVIIAGSRTITNKNKVFANIFWGLAHFGDGINTNILKFLEIVSGHAIGVDKLGEEWAKMCGMQLKIFPADWEKYGKKAGYIRNKEMADYADALILIWDGKSKGSKMMLELAEKKKLKIYEVITCV